MVTAEGGFERVRQGADESAHQEIVRTHGAM